MIPTGAASASPHPDPKTTSVGLHHPASGKSHRLLPCSRLTSVSQLCPFLNQLYIALTRATSPEGRRGSVRGVSAERSYNAAPMMALCPFFTANGFPPSDKQKRRSSITFSSFVEEVHSASSVSACSLIIRQLLALLSTNNNPALYFQDNENSSDEDSNFGFGEDIAEDDLIRPKARETAFNAMISGAPFGRLFDVPSANPPHSALLVFFTPI